MALTSEEWARIHKGVLDSVRAALDGLDDETLGWSVPGTEMSIAREAAHICNSERSWLLRAGFPSDVPELAKDCGAQDILQGLDSVESAYASLLRERPDDLDMLYGLARVCLHAIYHQGRIACFRIRQDPKWNYPKGASIHDAMDLIIDAMLR